MLQLVEQRRDISDSVVVQGLGDDQRAGRIPSDRGQSALPIRPAPRVRLISGVGEDHLAKRRISVSPEKAR